MGHPVYTCQNFKTPRKYNYLLNTIKLKLLSAMYIKSANLLRWNV